MALVPLNIRHNKPVGGVAPFVWPNAGNTGAILGGLTPYTGTRNITVPNTTLENRIITGQITVRTTGFVMRNCRVDYNFTGTGFGAYIVDGDFPGAGLMTIEDCTITGLGSAGNARGAVLGQMSILRCNISGTENGLTTQPGSTLIQANYIHDLGRNVPDPHIDGMEIYGGESNLLISDNRVMADDTSCVFMANLYGALTNITVTHNYLTGADVIIRCEGNKSSALVTGITITNNIMGTAAFGRFNIVDGPPGSTDPIVSGNVSETGVPVSP